VDTNTGTLELMITLTIGQSIYLRPRVQYLRPSVETSFSDIASQQRVSLDKV
jgi:hypothetical protein